MLGSGYSVAKEHPPMNGESIGVLIMGSIVQKNSASNVVLIKEIKSGIVKAVRPGTIILTNYNVTEVHEKYIILNRAEDKYVVYQDKFAGEFVGQNRPMDHSPANLTQGKDFYQEEGFERRSGQVKISGMYRDKLVNQDLAKVLMQATAEPAMQNGNIVGFKLTQIDSDSIYAKSGFLDSDVITVINGVKLNSASGAITLLRSLKQETKLVVEILRNNSPQTITIEVD